MVSLSNGTGIQVEDVQEHHLNLTDSAVSFMAATLMKFSRVDKSNAHICSVCSRQMQ